MPAVFSARLVLARRTGARAVELVRQGRGARRFLTPASLGNALVLDAALGCSTNTVLHLIAIAHEAGFEIPLERFNQVSAKTPQLVKLSPAGSWYMEDFHRAGGVMAVLHRLAEAGLIDGSVPTVSGEDLLAQFGDARPTDDEVIRPLDRPYSPTGGLAVLFGNLAPRGAVVKEGAVLPQMLRHRGPAQVFDDEASAVEAIASDRIAAGKRGRHPLRGTQGRARDAGDAHAHLDACRRRSGRPGRARDRRPLQRRHARRLRRPCGAGGGRRRAYRADRGRGLGSRSTSPAGGSRWRWRRKNWGAGKPVGCGRRLAPAADLPFRGVLGRYVKMVSGADKGAVLD